MTNQAPKPDGSATTEQHLMEIMGGHSPTDPTEPGGAIIDIITAGHFIGGALRAEFHGKAHPHQQED